MSSLAFALLIKSVDAKGAEYAHSCRQRLRQSYMAAKNYGKMQDWTDNNARAFEMIDDLCIGLVGDAGFEVTRPPVPLETATGDEFKREAARRGLLFSNIPNSPAAQPATDDANQVLPPAGDLETEITNAAEGLRRAGERPKVPTRN